MLTNEALNSSIPLTDVLDSNRLCITPTASSPLEALVRASRSDPKFCTYEGDQYAPNMPDIEYIANVKDPLLGFSPHDAAMDNIVDVATRAVANHMLFAKSVVAPAVQHLVESVTGSLQSLTPSTLLGMEVVVWTPPAPYQTNALATAARRFEEVPYDSPALSMKLPLITVAEIIDLMCTGSGGFDKEIRLWAATKGDSYFINLWESVFQQRQAGLNEARPLSFRDLIEDRVAGWDNALAIFLIARKLADAPLPNTEMNLRTFEQLAVDYRNQAGARVCRALDELDTIDKTGRLVRSTTDRVTVVNGSVYRKWIDQGGENEVLFGNLLELPAVATVDQINEKSAKLKGLWQRHAALTATVESNRRFVRTKELLIRHFEEQLRSLSETEDASLGNRELVVRLFRAELETVRADEISDLWTLCLRLVCRSRFHRTEAERILSGIERIKKNNPNVDVREAAAVSVIEYVAWWVSTQFKVTAV